MNAGVITSLIIAGVAVAGAIGSILLLAVRVGTLIGRVDGHIRISDDDRAKLWRELGRSNGRLDRHTEIYHGGRHDGR